MNRGDAEISIKGKDINPAKLRPAAVLAKRECAPSYSGAVLIKHRLHGRDIQLLAQAEDSS